MNVFLKKDFFSKNETHIEIKNFQIKFLTKGLFVSRIYKLDNKKIKLNEWKIQTDSFQRYTYGKCAHGKDVQQK